MAPEDRAAIRQARAKPSFDALEDWLHAQLPKISGKSPLAQAIRYALGRLPERPRLAGPAALSAAADCHQGQRLFTRTQACQFSTFFKMLTDSKI